ncbi:MAG: kynureninase [Frankiales bacterium]|nr:kynureninase [Frankiales bacterium]
MDRADLVRRDAADPLAWLRAEFVVPDDRLIYLDGNSLGRPARGSIEALRESAEQEWAGGLIRSWDDWLHLPVEVGEVIGRDFLGARPGETVVADSTSVNFYRLALAALDARPDRRVIVTESGNFPTDDYVLQGIAGRTGHELRRVPADLDDGIDPAALAAAIDDDVALVTLSHVSYRSGAVVDLPAVTELAHRHGALVLWDLCHSVGSLPIDLVGADADLAVGCTYKYLNGGPGSPAFLYVRRDLQSELDQPVWGWFGQREQFEMADRYEAYDDIRRFLVGTPPVLALRSLQSAVEPLAKAGITALRAKSLELTALAVQLTDKWLTPLGASLATPRNPERRGGHVTVHHPRARELASAMTARGVVPDFRTPDRIRLGLAPATTSFADVWDAWTVMRELMTTDKRSPA